MAHTLDWARRLIRELSGDPNRLVASSTYADPQFLSLYFEWVDDRVYHNPRAGLEWAKVAPDLALATPEGETPIGHRSRLVRAWFILGGAHRSCSDHDAADESYGQAMKLAKPGVTPAVRADMESRLSYLRACQGRADEALELASGAVESLRKLDRPLLLGQALIAWGYVLANEFKQYSAATDAFGEALALAGTGKGSPAVQRLHETACLNLALAAALGSMADLKTILRYLDLARRPLKGSRRTAARYRLLWVEALVWDRTGSHAKAARLYRKALEGFIALAMPWESALVGLDLCSLLHLVGDLAEFETVAAETFDRFRRLSGAPSQTLAALQLWADVVRRKAWAEDAYDEIHDAAREAIIAGIARGSCCKGRR